MGNFHILYCRHTCTPYWKKESECTSLTLYTHLSELNPSLDVPARIQGWYPHRLTWPHKHPQNGGRCKGWWREADKMGEKSLRAGPEERASDPEWLTAFVPTHFSLQDLGLELKEDRSLGGQSTVFSDTGLLNKEQFFKKPILRLEMAQWLKAL